MFYKIIFLFYFKSFFKIYLYTTHPDVKLSYYKIPETVMYLKYFKCKSYTVIFPLRIVFYAMVEHWIQI